MTGIVTINNNSHFLRTFSVRNCAKYYLTSIMSFVLFFFWFWAHTQWCLGVISGSVLRGLYVVFGDSNQVYGMQSKCLDSSTIFLALIFLSFTQWCWGLFLALWDHLQQYSGDPIKGLLHTKYMLSSAQLTGFSCSHSGLLTFISL